MTTAVIGGGIGGLTAANLLADAGERVLLVEARQRLGGRGVTDERDGHLFNLGPHALYTRGPGVEILASLGVRPVGGSPTRRGSLGILEGRLAALPSTPVALLRSPLIRGSERLELARVMGRLSTVQPSTLADRTCEAWLRETFSTRRLRDITAGLVRVSTYCADLDVLSADVAVTQLQLTLRDVVYVDGGWQQIVAALAARAVTAGVDIRQGCRVTDLRRAADGWEIVTGDHVTGADHVVLAVSTPQIAARLAGSDAIAGFAATTHPIALAVMDVGLTALPHPGRRFAYGLDEPVFYSVHGPPARLGAGATLHVARYLRRGERVPTHDLRAAFESTLDLVQPGWRGRLRTSRLLQRMIASNMTPTAAGGGMVRRFPVAVPDREGLFVVGDWVGARGHLVDTTLTSAAAAASAVVGQKELVA